MAISTPLRRSTRGIPLVSPAKSQFLPATGTSYQWLGQPIPSTTSSHTHYSSCLRITEETRSRGKGKGKAKEKTGQLMFRVGDGVLIGTVGDVGVAILVRLWEQDVEDEEEQDDEHDVSDGLGESERKEKMCEIRWCYRKKDLPGVMGKIQLSDHEVLYATSSSKPVTQIVPLTALVHTCTIIASEPFRELYQYYHHSYTGATKYITVAGSSTSDDDEEESENGDNHPPTLTLTVSDRIFRRGKGIIPLVYYCTRAFDKFAKGGKGIAWWDIDVEEVMSKGKKEGIWDVEKPKRTKEDEERDRKMDEMVKLDRIRGKKIKQDSSDDSGEEFEGADESADEAIDGAEESEDDGRDMEESTPRKRKSKTTSRPTKKRKSVKEVKLAQKRNRTRQPANDDPFKSIELDKLPKDPFERALHLLHVGATPDSLPKRETEYLEVMSRVQEGVESGNGGCLYIAGVPGTGKTATVHAVIKDLRRQVEEFEIPPFSYVEINGLKIPTPQHAYSVLWDAISGTTGSSSKTALRSLEEHFGVVGKQRGIRGPRGHTFVVLMDELDQLLTAKQDVVYNFFNWPTLRDSQLFVIAVANRMDLPQQLAAKVKSRLGMQSLYFQPYDREDLMAIAQSRLVAHPHDSRDPQVLHSEAIRLAAMKMAGTNGDARRVLDACRRAVEVAIETANKNEMMPAVVSVKDMQMVLKALTSSPVALFLKQCTVYEKIMLAAVLRCIRREGVPEISWLNVCRDHDNLIKSMFDTASILSNAELQIVFQSLLATRTLTYSNEKYKVMNDRKLALGLGMDANEVGRVLMAEGEDWARVLAGL